ncbi:hypothetical protein K474DRAFT_1667581 [Panus rudis PR-1116 ss-1]|nr:hypothetical protein K474DRAFT_1667581 [Panus rudis PR-1116 ss-1]
MGSSQSYLSTPVALIVVVIVGAVSYVVTQRSSTLPQPPPSSTSLPPTQVNSEGEAGSGVASSSKKSKKKKRTADAPSDTNVQAPAAQPNVVSFPPVIPGGFEAGSPVVSEGEATKKSKSKKKKTKKTGVSDRLTVPSEPLSDSSATAPESHVTSPSRPNKKKSPTPKPAAATSQLDDDGQWTRVESRKRTASHQAQPRDGENTPRPGDSDAGITTSVTGTSSPGRSVTDDEQRVEQPQDNRKTLAEKLLPKPRKTVVDDMLETPAAPSLARVMRVQPRPDEKPAAGFSWADYEDVDESRLTADDADGEDDGWIVQSSKKPKAHKPSSPTASGPLHAPETITKKQRQHAAKREAQKAAKAEAEAERLAKLAKHKQELERERIAEQYKTQAKNKKTSGGMTAFVNEKGQMVWD